MAKQAKPKSSGRMPVTRERAVFSAVVLADADGLPALTMRKLAKALGVEAMSLYHHVANKEDLLDGMIDLVFGEIDLPRQGARSGLPVGSAPSGGARSEVEMGPASSNSGAGWKAEMLRRSESVRTVLLRHPWAVGIMESRVSPGPSILRHHDAVLGCLRGGGFSVPLAAHAFALIDSYVYGFVLQEVNLPFNDEDEIGEMVEQILPMLSVEEYPHLVELTVEHVMKPGYRFGDEFAYGLNLILDGLERNARRG
jgi:AcrR family transcriptional regulator